MLALLPVFLLGCTTEPQAESASQQAPFKVIGYASLRLDNYWDSVNAQLPFVTHINVAFANPADDASGEIAPINEALLQQTVELAHQEQTQVFISFGGWRGDDSGHDLVYEQIAANDTARQAFIDNIVAMVKRFNLDGVDMDWEYPRMQGAADYERFIVELAQALHRHDKQLTAAVIGTKTKVTDDGDGAAYSDRALAAFDWINLMAYDARPDDHSPYKLVEQSTDYWLGERGIAPHKAVLGLPIYARPSWRSYRQVVANDPHNACVDTVNFSGKPDYYNGLPTIANKTRFALNNKLGGVMVWELALDSTAPELSIMQAIHAEVNGQPVAAFCDNL
jgi:GH18 family chitinase